MFKIKEPTITSGIIWKQLVLFFLPILFGSFFQNLYSAADAIIVGRFAGKEALAAIDSTMSMVRLLISLFVGISTGASILISQQFGAGKHREISSSVHTSIAFSLAGGVVLMALGIAMIPSGMSIIRIPEEIREMASQYLFIYFCGMIPSMAYNMAAGALRAMGDSRHPLYFLIASCVINIVLDILFVAVFQWGVAGAGIATVIAQLVSAILSLLTLSRMEETYRLRWKRIRLEKQTLKSILRIGIPVSIQSLMYPISNLIIQTSVNQQGTNAIAAWAVCGKLDFIIWMIIDALSIATATFVGQNFGAGKMDRVKDSIRACLVIAHIVILPLSAFLVLGSDFFGWFIVNDAEVVTLAANLMRYYAPFFITYIWGEVLASAIRGMGETLRPMIFTLLGTCALRIGWMFLIVPLHNTLFTIILCYPVSWAVTSLLFVIYYIGFFSKKIPRTVRETSSL